MSKKFSEHFKLNKSQGELDFIDVEVNRDMPLFLDPMPLSQRTDRWSQDCHTHIVTYFQHLIDCIKKGDEKTAKEMLMYLREPNETRLGLSAQRPQGAGIGGLQAQQIFNALKDSSAIKTGLISSLEECELMIEGVGRDKISDLTTNLIRGLLVEYTNEQCALHGVPIRSVPLAPCFDVNKMQWVSQYHNLPVVGEKPVLLVPKTIARYDFSYEHQNYYRHYVLNYLQAEALHSGSGLVRVLKSGVRKVYKKDVEDQNPLSKEFLYEFSKKHSKVLDKYRKDLVGRARQDRASDVDDPNIERSIAGGLAQALKAISPGHKNASNYHNLMIGTVEFIFYPHLMYPKKEREIHDGRKRIDIAMENGARSGIFHRLHDVRKLICWTVFFECKNYVTEIGNPEIDQLSGRFGDKRGRLGFLCCRNFEDRTLFIKRCQDTLSDGRGLIVPLDDVIIQKWLNLIQQGKRNALDAELTDLIGEVWR